MASGIPPSWANQNVGLWSLGQLKPWPRPWESRGRASSSKVDGGEASPGFDSPWVAVEELNGKHPCGDHQDYARAALKMIESRTQSEVRGEEALKNGLGHITAKLRASERESTSSPAAL